MGFSAIVDRMVWPSSLLRDRKWPRVTKFTYSRVVGLRLEGSLVFTCTHIVKHLHVWSFYNRCTTNFTMIMMMTTTMMMMLMRLMRCADDVDVRRRRDAIMDRRPTGGRDARRRRPASVRRRRRQHLDTVPTRRQRSTSTRGRWPSSPCRLDRRTRYSTPAVRSIGSNAFILEVKFCLSRNHGPICRGCWGLNPPQEFLDPPSQRRFELLGDRF